MNTQLRVRGVNTELGARAPGKHFPSRQDRDPKILLGQGAYPPESRGFSAWWDVEGSLRRPQAEAPATSGRSGHPCP